MSRTAPTVRPAAVIAAALMAAAAHAPARAAAQTSASTAAPNATPAYHVSRRVRLGGTGGWDYLTVDTLAHRLYLTRGTHVMVVDTRTDSLVGDVGDTPGVHGVALAPALGRGWTSNGRDSSATAFDLNTLVPVARVALTGRNPDAITYDGTSGRVFAFNGASANATAFDATTRTGRCAGARSRAGSRSTAHTGGCSRCAATGG